MEPNPLDLECLRGFDHARFGVLARSLQVLLGRGAIDYAIAAVREFARQTRRQAATPASQLVDVLPLKLANSLETIGCTTLRRTIRDSCVTTMVGSGWLPQFKGRICQSVEWFAWLVAWLGGRLRWQEKDNSCCQGWLLKRLAIGQPGVP